MTRSREVSKGATRVEFVYTATAGQTSFSGNDGNSNSLAYTAGQIDVFLNGVRLAAADYTATNGTAVVLGVGAEAGDTLNVNAFGTFSVADVIVDRLEFDYTATAGQTSFTGSDIALSFGYAYNVPFTSIYLGANAKLISSTLESYSSFGAAVDIGALYVDEKNDINWAIAIRNVGTQITTYAGTQEKLPFEILLGVSQEVENVPIRWHLTLENMQQWNIAFSNPNRAVGGIDGSATPEKVSFLNNAFRHVILGVELFPTKGFNIRLGYNFRRAAELKIIEQRSFSGISAGIGIKMGKLKFNYSYSRYTLAASTSLFGLTINFADEGY